MASAFYSETEPEPEPSMIFPGFGIAGFSGFPTDWTMAGLRQTRSALPGEKKIVCRGYDRIIIDMNIGDDHFFIDVWIRQLIGLCASLARSRTDRPAHPTLTFIGGGRRGGGARGQLNSF